MPKPESQTEPTSEELRKKMRALNDLPASDTGQLELDALRAMLGLSTPDAAPSTPTTDLPQQDR